MMRLVPISRSARGSRGGAAADSVALEEVVGVQQQLIVQEHTTVSENQRIWLSVIGQGAIHLYRTQQAG